MSRTEKQPRNAVSFTTFRRMQLLAVKRLWSCLWTCNDVDDTVHFTVWGLIQALEEARFVDAVALSRTLAEQQYGDPTSYRLGAQIVALVKKVPFKDPDLDPDSAALAKFLQAEADCAEVNAVMRPLVQLLRGNGIDKIVGPRVNENRDLLALHVVDESSFIVNLLFKARRHFQRALGKPDVSKILSMARFGSGSSVGVHGNATHFLRKISTERWTVSPLCLPYAEMAAAMTPAFWYALGLDPTEAKHLWASEMQFYKSVGLAKAYASQDPILAEFKRRFRARVELVSDDLITYVPKDADCSRTVGTQPLLNMFVQLGAGDYLKGVLLDACGICLEEDQLNINGPLAFLASYCDGTTFATVDLASASDTIAKLLVRFLASDEWYTLLNSFRTPSFKIPEEGSHAYEKFCAMGNGFCFPLETLVFWSLVQAVYDVVDVPDRTCAVYGDDIIVYQPAALLLIELLDACGFRTNNSKTFVHGPFRESCGQDFFNGVNVRPVVLDEVIEGLGQAYHFINSLSRKGYTSLAAELRELLPADRIHMRPYAGDTTTALEVPWDVFMASRHARFKRVPEDPKKPYYHAWSWVELMPTAVNDEEDYDERCHMSAALLGATSHDGKPVYAYRRKTRVRVRELAHG